MRMMKLRSLTPIQATEYLLIVIALLLVIGRFFGGTLSQAPTPPKQPPKSTTVTGPCVGDPIVKGYDYTGGYIEDFACKGMCDTPHYVLYKNGFATQCALVPPDAFCNDKQEDAGQTCTPPDSLSPASARK
jgi:hypothetical protein